MENTLAHILEEQEEIDVPEGMFKVHCACDDIIPIEHVKPHPKNPNKHPRKQLELLGKIIEANGWRVPITISTRSGLLIKGEGRYLAAQLAGQKFIPVDYQNYESEEHELADLVADNRITRLSEIDVKTERELIATIDTGVIDLEITGFSARELENMFNETREDEDKTLYPITAKLHEKYDYVLIFTTNETDRLFLHQVLGVRKERSYKSKAVGIGRAIPFERFTEALTAYKEGRAISNENIDSVNESGNDNDNTPVVE